MNNCEREINLKSEIDRLHELLNEKTKKLEVAHLEIASLVDFICKSKIVNVNVNVNANANAKQTPDGQDVNPQSKF